MMIQEHIFVAGSPLSLLMPYNEAVPRKEGQGDVTMPEEVTRRAWETIQLIQSTLKHFRYDHMRMCNFQNLEGAFNLEQGMSPELIRLATNPQS